MKTVAGAFRFGAKACNKMAQIFSPPSPRVPPVDDTNPPGSPWDRWFKDQGDKNLRLNYDLDSTSVVVDLGGYEGQWASDIFAKYLCSVYVFEPVPEFAEKLRKRFSKNAKVKVFEFGLAPKTETSLLWMSQDASSALRPVSQGEPISIQLQSIDEFLREANLEQIDLLKVNIEGGEYDLLEHLIRTGGIRAIRNLQVQFHDFVENAELRMTAIQQSLAKTHEQTFSYRFVWENWKLKETSIQ